MLNRCSQCEVRLYGWIQYGCRVCKCRVVDVEGRKVCVCVGEVQR